jgi:transposase InsO family protein
VQLIEAGTIVAGAALHPLEPMAGRSRWTIACGGWSTRVDLANAMFEYLEVFHNRQRRHSSLGMLTPVEFEARRRQPTTAA